jgi:hypothetical protein
MKYYREIVADKLGAAAWSWGTTAMRYKGWLVMLEWMRLRAIWESRLRRATIQGNFHKFIIDSAASATVYAKLLCGVALHQAEIKPDKR